MCIQFFNRNYIKFMNMSNIYIYIYMCVCVCAYIYLNDFYKNIYLIYKYKNLIKYINSFK